LGENPESGESGSNACFLVKREIVSVRSGAELAEIELLRAQCERLDLGEHAEALRAATADYAAQQVEDKLNISWWQTRANFPLTGAADVLNNSTGFLRGLVECPLAAAGNAVGAGDPVMSIFATITAYAATERVTAPLENAARTCEVAGVLIGLATGTPHLVVACGKRFIHDELGKALAGAFERVLDPEPGNREKAVGKRHNVQTAGRANEEAVEVSKRSSISANTSGPHRSQGQDRWPSSGTPQARCL
jgi:hypothetical protein